MIKSNSMASTVGHTEDCLYNIKTQIEDNGSYEQRMALLNALDALETLYMSLREEE